MSYRTLALATAAAGVVAGSTLAASPAQAASTDSCYQFTVNAYTNFIPLIPWEDNIESAAKAAGVSVVFGSSVEDTHSGLACAPSSYTVYKMLKGQQVHDVKFTNAHSTADGTFELKVEYIPGAQYIWAPEQAVAASARNAGLTVVKVDYATRTVTVSGDPATVYGQFNRSGDQVSWITPR